MCLLSAGLVDKLLDSNYHGNWVWVGFEIIPPVVNETERQFVLHADIKSIASLGKKADHPRPLLVELSDGSLKGMIFKNLPKLANHPEESFRKIRMKHDMTKDERERAKLLSTSRPRPRRWKTRENSGIECVVLPGSGGSRGAGGRIRLFSADFFYFSGRFFFCFVAFLLFFLLLFFLLFWLAFLCVAFHPGDRIW